MSKSTDITAEVTGYGETRDAKRPFARIEVSHTGPDGTVYSGTLAVMAERGWRDRKPASSPSSKGKASKDVDPEAAMIAKILAALKASE